VLSIAPFSWATPGLLRVGVIVVALEFLILTAVPTREVQNAVWSEFDLENKIWTIPADRTKTGKQHQVPLSSRALELLQRQLKTLPFVFPGRPCACCCDLWA
jgi:integrase